MNALKWRVVGVALALATVAVLASPFLTSPARAQTTPSITSITVSDTTIVAANITVNLADADDGTMVYLKYGPVNSYNTNPKPPAYNVYGDDPKDPFLLVNENAPPLEATSLSGAATFDLPASAIPPADRLNRIQDLWASYDVLVEASLDSTFETGVVTETFRTLPPEVRGGCIDSEKTSMGILLYLSSFSGIPYTVYYRWRAEDSTTWNTGSVVVPWGNPTSSSHRVMTGLVSHSPYVMDASLDPNFPEDKTHTETAWTHEPDVVRIGVRKVTETEATVTAIMDHPNGKEYGLGCRYHPNAQGNWSYIRNEHTMTGFVGATLLQSLTLDSPYQYRCKLSYDHGEHGEFTRTRASDEKSTRTLDGTDTALTEIRATLSGRSATITVDLVNTDGTNNDVYLRHREYPSDEWVPGTTRATSTNTAQWTATLTNNKVHEFEASLDQAFPEAETLTLYLVVGNPPYTTVGDSTPTTREPDTTGNEPNQDITPNNDPNNGGIDPNDLNNGNNNPPSQTNNPVTTSSSGGGGGGGFGGGGFSTRNTPPNFRDSASKMRSVPENSVEDVKVGDPIMAWDPENDAINFSLRGDDAAPFKIETMKGGYRAQLLVGPDAVLDYEAQSVHMVTIVATDPGGEERSIVLEVQLEDVKLPGRADEFDVANNHDERLDREEVEAAYAALGLNLLTRLEMAFIMDYYFSTNFGAIDFGSLPRMVDKYDLNEDSIIDRSEILQALQDYVDGTLSKADMQEIAKVYFITAQAEETAQPEDTG